MDIDKIEQQTIVELIGLVLQGATDNMSPGQAAISAISLFADNMRAERDRLLAENIVLTDSTTSD